MENEQQSQSNSNESPKNEQSQTIESSDEGEEDIQLDNIDDIDSTLLQWIKENKLTFIKEILLQQEISLTEIASLSHNQRKLN